MSQIRPDQMSNDELERERLSSRRRVEADVEALSAKLEPEYLWEEAVDAARNKKDELVDRARRRAGEAGEELSEEIRSNPLPYALVGAGLAWLLVDASMRRSGRVGRVGRRVRSKARNAMPQLRERAGAKMEDVKDRARDTRARLDERYHDVRKATHDAGQRSMVVAREAGERAQGFYFDNPLIVGGLAISAGLTLGLLLPATGREVAIVGERSADLQKQARDFGHGIADDAKEIARDTAEHAKTQVREAAHDMQAMTSEDRHR